MVSNLLYTRGMSRDLLLGRTRRDWSIGGAVPTPTPGPTTRDEQVEELIMTKRPQRMETPSAQSLVLSKLREASPEAMALYDKYKPTYKDHQVVIRTKI